MIFIHREQHQAEGPKRFGTFRTGGSRRRHRLYELQRPVLIPRKKPVVGGRNAQAMNVVYPFRRRETHGHLTELGGGDGGPSRDGSACRILERFRRLGVGSVRCQRQVPGAFLRIFDDFREPAMDPVPVVSRRCCVDRRAVQRVREAHVVAVGLNDARVHRLRQLLGHIRRLGYRLEQSDRWPRACRRVQQRLAVGRG